MRNKGVAHKVTVMTSALVNDTRIKLYKRQNWVDFITVQNLET